MIGYALCGSFCTLSSSLDALAALCAAGEQVQPIFSERAATTDTRFGRAADHLARATALCGRPPITDIVGAEPLGPARPLDFLILAPCTGNTLAKIAQGITDSAVTMATKAHLRTGRPLLIALASNDAMSANLENIGRLLMRKNVFFVPLVQDDPAKKPDSLVADLSRLPAALAAARAGRQLRPLFLEK